MGGSGSFNVDLVNSSWTEFGITYNNSPTLGTTIASSIPLTSANVHDYVIVDVTSAVQAWLDGSQPNDGIALVANSGLGVLFDSKENTATSHPPELDIVFASGGGTITGVTTAPGSGLSGGGTSGTLPLSLIACGTNQVLQYSAASWGCATISGGGGGITGSGTVNSLPLFNGLTSLASSNVSQSGTNIGIGTTTPAATLDVNGAVNAATSFNLGENIFVFGSFNNGNAFLGFAGNGLMTGTYNTATGWFALGSNAKGGLNTADGAQALYSNQSGINNTASGFQSLYNNVSGGSNTANGFAALMNTTGTGNTAAGANSLGQNSMGSFNTALGFFAGQVLDKTPGTGLSDTAVGAGAAFSTGTLSNATAIGSNAEVTASNSLVLGAITGVNGGTNTSVGIGTTAPAATLDVEGSAATPPTVNFGSTSIPATLAVNGNTTLTGNLTVTGTCTGCGSGGGGGITTVTAGTGLSGGGSAPTVTLSANQSVVAFQTDLANGVTTAESFATAAATAAQAAAETYANSTFATLGPNTFTGNQTITGMVGIGTTTPQVALDVNGAINAATSFDLPQNGIPQAFVWAPGGQSTGIENTAVGWGAMASWANGGALNTAIGSSTLQKDTQ
jgi:hypothetical protein